MVKIWTRGCVSNREQGGTRATFSEDRRGTTAVIVGLCIGVLVSAVGFAVDLSRYQNARAAIQQAVDGAVLAAASSSETTEAGLKPIAKGFFNQNMGRTPLAPDYKDSLVYSDGRLTLTVDGRVDLIFGGLLRMNSLPLKVMATAERGGNETVEVALVLDNTWSMSAQSGDGQTRIQALKSASALLVGEIMTGPNAGRVKIGVVPYADYVNVGMGNRNQPWLSVPADYTEVRTTKGTPRQCTTRNTRRVCTKGPKKTCTTHEDGVPRQYDCTPNVCRDEPSEPYEQCTGGTADTTTNVQHRWNGCVGSRKEGKLRLNDEQPSKAYPGFLDTNCLNPILPLTGNRGTVDAALKNLIINRGTSYRPYTHIPSGLVWGVNVLSPTAPFVEGAAYGPGNKRPRKILVLMTDGENTLRFEPGEGKHPQFDAQGNKGNVQKIATDKDTADICTYAKSKEIEVFTVLFAVDSLEAQSLLRNCASPDDEYQHAFNAADTMALRDAFAAIARSINEVRLVH